VSTTRRICVITGTRAEYGLLRGVMRAIADHDDLDLDVVVTGTHLLPPACTIDEVRADFEVATVIEMQRPDESGRSADAAALGRGVSGCAAHFALDRPDVVLVLGDRIEALAAASAAAVAGIRVAHMHGGDRAEGIADEGMRHAITKLAHVHLPATDASGARIVALGEDAERVHVVGSPAIDEVVATPPLDDAAYERLGAPEIVFLLHPTGDDASVEAARAATLLTVCGDRGRVLALDPNHDAGRAGIVEAIESSGVGHRAHLPRSTFLGLLKRARMIVGNSSAGLIEAAAVPIRCVNVGRRQGGRERPGHVIDCHGWEPAALEAALDRCPAGRPPVEHPYGDGSTARRTADVLARFDPRTHPLTKRNTF
jgi:UDP-hydrolysing UDP-N-acetyl-D-glucosamine 2-epimerase